MNVWKVTADGVQTARYSSTPLPVNTRPDATANGYLRFSLDGESFAWAGSDDYIFIFGKFNPATGEFSNIKSITYGYEVWCYGVEFSPSGKILYVSTDAIGNNNKLYVYRFEELLASPNTGAPRVMNFMENNKKLMPLQLGPDGRIYGRATSTASMVVIDNVEDYDLCTLTEVSGLVPSDLPSNKGMGLPTFPSDWLQHLIPVANPDDGVMSGSMPVPDVPVNDDPGDCTAGSVDIDVATPTTSGVKAGFNAENKPVYTPHDGFAGRDSTTYTITCGAASGTAK
jgi:hypothetical protein